MKKIIITIVLGFLFIFVGAGMMVYGYTRDDFSLDSYTLEEYEKEEFTYAKNEITKIVFEAEIDYLKIISTNEESFKIEGKKSESLIYNYNLDNQTLTIKQEWKDKIKSLFSFGEVNINTPYIIYVPADSLKTLNVNIQAGNLEISEIDLETLVIDLNAGDLDVVNSNVGSIEADVKAGDVDINVLSSNSIDVYVNVGDLDILAANTKNIKSKVNTGSLYYQGSITIAGDFKCDVGDIILQLEGNDYKIDGVGSGNAIITTDVNIGDASYYFN